MFIGATALVLGSWIMLWLRAAGAVLPGDGRKSMLHLAYSLTPMGGFGVFLGLSAMTVTLLKPEGLTFDWLPAARAALLVLAALWSAWLALRMLGLTYAAARWRKALALCCILGAVAGAASVWVMLFFVW